jgi:hypothetical protein
MGAARWGGAVATAAADFVASDSATIDFANLPTSTRMAANAAAKSANSVSEDLEADEEKGEVETLGKRVAAPLLNR